MTKKSAEDRLQGHAYFRRADQALLQLKPGETRARCPFCGLTITSRNALVVDDWIRTHECDEQSEEAT